MHTHGYRPGIYINEDDFFDPNPFSEGCTERCRQEFFKTLEYLRERLKIQIEIFKHLKKNEDGSFPTFNIYDVYSYYEGRDDELQDKNIQDLFDVDILSMDISHLKKRTDIPKSVERKEKETEIEIEI
ncbi:hypothetical protein DICPUDRAFT_75219 [Dictyostelium purpureum]|uniref:Uncharacterized protein n=1 Tax=Dictyostelium purpureum TaxID=5786 RepID=F0ZA09_DICPU|nr:uncharacterized protein DICPUDRAFT_75219 [Dictyostelium purpureum]EGC39210.1 hypothetical protein DICPUDRAFT_75219 [Dictyostelium purpureum]|eukprot:XP_003284237.1 hypothetical protein DICPUDRAFT_75219 [Dictyostelium purpureum]